MSRSSSIESVEEPTCLPRFTAVSAGFCLFLAACGGGTEDHAAEGPTGGAASGGGEIDAGCDIVVIRSEVSPRIRTVGLLEFSTDTDVTGAVVEFGLDTKYGMTATAEASGTSFSAVLLGMKPNTTYHYRVVVAGSSGDCASRDQTIQSGPLGQGIKRPTEESATAGTAPGFIVVATGYQALIVDSDSDVVWGVDLRDELSGSFIGMTSAKLSWDGAYMYARDLGPFDAATGGKLVRISIDGSTTETLPLPGGHHHDFAVIPRGIAYIGKREAGECDFIFTARPDGTRVQLLVDLGVVFEKYPKAAGREACHVNAINYYPDRELFSVADREKDVIAVFDVMGRPVTAIGQVPFGELPFTPVIAEGATTAWRVQHGHDLYADDRLVLFSNHEMGAAESPVLHYTIRGNKAKLDWQYTDLPPSGTQGDADHLPNGNFLLTSSTAGEIHELNENRELVRTIEFSGGIGYVDYRTSLYGPPL